MSGMDGMKLGASGAWREEQVGSETLMTPKD
ncbi:rCG54638 [Rattus norvegicus]|uniref:RCG54638 n=1 Tax=Rattus norvegicus TaxID=10116 RepID=A6JB68_RAT|nr:rCG54638 [Rattus norvegicus]